MHYPNPRHLRAFVAVATLRSFHGAASTLHIGQPALSQAIAKLEEIVGVKLLERTTRSVSLTPAGEEFLADARRVLESNERLLQHGTDWATGGRGRLSILCIPSVAHRLLPNVMRLFKARYPGVQVEVHDLPDPVLRDRMSRDDGDLAILSLFDEGQPADHLLPLLRDRFRLVCRVDHPMSRQKTVDGAAVAAQPLVMLRRGTVYRAFMDGLLGESAPPLNSVEVDQVATLLGMVEAGLGVSILPGLGCPSPALTSIVTRPLVRPELSRMLALARPERHLLRPAGEAFVRVVLDFLRSSEIVLPEGVEPLTSTQEAQQRFFAAE